MRQSKFFVAVVLTSSLILIFFYSSLNLQETNRQRPFAEVVDSGPPRGPINVPVLSQNASVAASLVYQDITNTPTPKPMANTKQRQSEIFPVLISSSFRQAILHSNGYWKRRQHRLLEQIDSGVLGTMGVTTVENKNKEMLGRSYCSMASEEELRINIQDFGSYPALYQDFLRGMECRDPPILIDQPDKCAPEDHGGRTFLLFAIKSVPKNFERRQVVRQTWGQEGLHEGGMRVRTVFLLGRPPPVDPDLAALLTFEAQHFGDILQWDFQESLYNLSLKENAFLVWAVRRCPRVSFIFKGDDDVFANTPAMLAYLLSLPRVKADKLYAGHVVTNASPFRDAKSKYYVPQTFYEGGYPAYAGGGGFVFSGSLLGPLLRLSQFIPFFPIDDVYTGMCFQALGIAPEAHKGFQTFDIREQDRGNACAHRNLIVVHQRSPQQTLQLWKDMHSPLLTC
ncbi:hypothetical protein JZ751_002111 [Albula glossodonta]|uniref:Hexosyltransferase n=1 Tax=Albula glossodonta TaxID=121402 RepID=A0A8T2P9I5_9TELE|nr:hypothetical protein JZ751_002111 [Albula glossodonta]